MTLQEMLRRANERLNSLIATRQSHTDRLTAMRGALETDPTITVESITQVTEARRAVDVDIEAARSEIYEIEAEIAREAEIAELSARSTRTAPPAPAQ
jgi:septal ring factor EnvC (AmiA/AmiB activator)